MPIGPDRRPDESAAFPVSRPTRNCAISGRIPASYPPDRQ
jgi:hypothetical protein